ncbi:MAG: hypothetical protein ACUVQK_13815 [Thermogutta sp.]
MKIGSRPLMVLAALLDVLLSALCWAGAAEVPSPHGLYRDRPSPHDSAERQQPWYVLPAPANPVFRGTPRFRWGDLGVQRSTPAWSSRGDYYGRSKQWARF